MPSNITNIRFRSAAPNFERDQVKSKNMLYAAEVCDYDKGHIVYCLEDESHYTFKPIREGGLYKKRPQTGYFVKFNTGDAGESGKDGKDGKSVEYIYLRNSSGSQPENPTPSDWSINEKYQGIGAFKDERYIPDGWSRSPLGITLKEQYEWICSREYNNDMWSEFSDPVLWAKYGDRGPKGDKGDAGMPGESVIGMRTVFTFCTSLTEPATPVGGYWNTTDNTITYPTDPDGKVIWGPTDDLERPVWMSTGEFIKDDPGNPKWSKPIQISGMDGTNGADGVNLEFIYKLTKTSIDAPTKPTSVNITDNVPDGWTDSPQGISEAMQCEWVCTRKVDNNGNWGDWSEPSIWAKWGANGMDGDGVEYIYYVNNGMAVSNPTPHDWETNAEYQDKDKEYIPGGGWSDNPHGVSETTTHEWVCVRKFRNNKWLAFSDPALWAKWGADGYNGISLRTLYTRTAGSDDFPEFEPENINPGSAWGLSIPPYEYPEAIWSISAYVNYKNELVEVGEDENKVYGWQGPVLVSGIRGLTGIVPNYKTYVYANSNSKPNKPTSDDPKNPGRSTNEEGKEVLWVDYPIGVGLWWQCVGVVNGMTETIEEDEYGDLMWSEVTQLNGRDGNAQPGKHWEVRFAASSSESAPNINKNSRDPSTGSVTWVLIDKNTPAPTVPQGGTLWQTMAEIDADNTLVDGWCDPFRISGEKGPKGDSVVGDTGPTGIPGVSFENVYCLGTIDDYNGSMPSSSSGTTNKDGVDTNLTIPSGWSKTMPTPTKEYLYIWCIQGKKIYSRNLNDDGTENINTPFKWVVNWSSPFVLSGTAGPAGANGQMVYPAGIYDPNATYETTDSVAPYVYFEGTYYVLNEKMIWNGADQTSNPATSTAWVAMDMFDAIYSDIGIFKQALVGSAVFYQDYIFSQQGVENGAPSTNYQNFGSTFTPNWMANLKTGEQWFGAGKSRFNGDGSGLLANGKIKWNETGEATIGGIKINDKGLGTNGKFLREFTFISPDGEFDFGKITSELTVNTAHDRFSTCSYNGNTLSLTSSSTGSNSYFTDIFYVNFDDFIFRISQSGIYATKNGKEYDILDLLEKGGGSGEGGGSEGGGSNVIFVDSLPTGTEPGKLYVIS